MSRCRSISRLMTWAWIDTSSADTGSSPMMSLGLRASARATPMRWRWPPENWCGKLSICARLSPTRSNSAATRSRRSARAADAVHLERLADDVAGALPRVERGERVLEDDLQLPAVGPELLLAEARDVVAVELDGAGGRLDQAHDGAAHRGLAAAALADQPQRLARADREAHAVDGIDMADGAAQQALAHGEVLAQSRHLEHGHAGLRHLVRRHRTPGSHLSHWPSPRSCRSASRRPNGRGASPRRAGTAPRQVSSAKAQRGANVQAVRQVAQRRHHAGDLLQALRLAWPASRRIRASRGIEFISPRV